MAFLLGVAGLLAGREVSAQSSPDEPSPDDEPIADYPADQERAPSAEPEPDAARGLAEAPDEPEDIALAVPRAILFVPAQILEIAFTPLRWLGYAIDEYHLRQHVMDFLYNDERTAALYPLITFQSDFGPSIGAGAFHKDLFGHEERLSGRMLFLGEYDQSYRAAFSADHFLGTPVWLEARAHYDEEQGVLFAGLDGPPRAEAPSFETRLDPYAIAVRSRFHQERVLALLRVGATIGDRPRMAQVGATVKYNHRLAEPSEDEFDNPTIQSVYETTRLVGFGTRWDTFELDANLVVDKRDTLGFTSSGFLLEAFGGGVVPGDDHGGYGHYGAEASLFIDLYKHRVLTLRAGTEGVVGSDDDIHFGELPQLGGTKSLRGYPFGLFRGKKAVLGTVQYSWPVHTYVAGELFTDFGRVGSDYEAIFGDDDGWRPGVGGGFIVHSGEDTFMRFDVAWGMNEGVGVFFSTGPLQDLDQRSIDL